MVAVNTMLRQGNSNGFIGMLREYGFLLSDRFLRDYRRHFGESPTTSAVPTPLTDYGTVDKAAAWNKRATHATRPGNLFGQCGVSIPIHMLGSALPVGLQLMCSANDDASLLCIAQGIEQALGRPPASDLSEFA